MSWISLAPHPTLALLGSGSHQLRSPELLGNSPIQSTMHMAICNTNTLSSFILTQSEPVRLTVSSSQLSQSPWRLMVSSSQLSPPSWLLQSPHAEPGRLLYLTLTAGHLCSCSSRALPLLFFFSVFVLLGIKLRPRGCWEGMHSTTEVRSQSLLS